MWPPAKTAFLVIHGNGPHRPYETLDRFAGKFYELLQQNCKVDKEHRLDDQARSYVRFKCDRCPYIDFYEYYWDRHMVREATKKEIWNWIYRIDVGIDNLNKLQPKGARRIYDNPPFLLKRFKGRRLGFLFRIALRVDIFFNKIREQIEDASIYCLTNERSKYYKIREKMLSGAVDKLTGLMESGENYERIIIVSHSLGTVIAYDALNRIVRDISSPSPLLGVKQGLEQRIKGLVTFGSFLDVFAFCFQEHMPPKNDMERWITHHRHAFKKKPSNYDFGNPFNYNLLNVEWLNFYHPKDMVANQELYNYDINYQIKLSDLRDGAIELKCWESLLRKIPFIKSFKESMEAHKSYWENPEMYVYIAYKFFNDTGACDHSK